MVGEDMLRAIRGYRLAVFGDSAEAYALFRAFVRDYTGRPDAEAHNLSVEEADGLLRALRKAKARLALLGARLGRGPGGRPGRNGRR